MNSGRKRVIFDTSTLVSAMLNAKALPALSFKRALETCDIYISQETFDELAEVIFREKFDRYFPDIGCREQFLYDLAVHAILAKVTFIATDCVDPKDNIFLSLAVSVKADYLVSSDKKHLLSMNPYHGTCIISAADFYKIPLLQ